MELKNIQIVGRWGALVRSGLSVALSGLLLTACVTDDTSDAVGTARQSLSVEQNRVLGFEAPQQDWATTNGSPVSASVTVSQGSASLSVQPNGYTEVVSTQIVAPGSALETATVDLQVPQVLGWGDVRLIVQIPSAGQYWRDLGGNQIGGLTSGSFHTLSFPVPSDVRAALNSSATDVNFRVVLNVPWGSGTYLLDNLVVSDDSGTTPSQPETEEVTFSLSVPRGTSVPQVIVSATNKVTIDDRSTIAEAGQLSKMANLGPSLLELGAGVNVYTDVFSTGDVSFLRSQSHVYGSMTTAGTVINQDNVVVDGEVTTGADVQAVTTNWTVNWPTNVTRDVSRPPDSPALLIEPGAWDSIQVFSRGGLVFESGTYFINSLVIEPQAELIMDVSNGPVQIYVRDTLRLRASLLFIGGDADVLFGYLGNQPALFEEALTAAVVAPNSAIELRRPASGRPHRGAFFGKEVHVFSDATVLHDPLNFSFACPSGDWDGDGALDCFDECWRDPNKTDPGICDCGTPDTDTDADGVPDCMDECRFDASIQSRGMCKCPSDPDVASPDTPCNDGLVPGKFFCDDGWCGDDDPTGIKPEIDCWLKTVGNRGFWICPGGGSGRPATSGDPSGAAALCARSPGGHLAEFSTYQENALLSSLLTLLDGPAWIGAADFTTEGSWYWRGRDGSESTQFWTGGSSGRRVHGAFTAWAGGKPPTDDGKNCATLDASGEWHATDCSEPHPYVCEFPFANDLSVDAGIEFDPPKGPAEIIPGWLDRYPEGNGPLDTDGDGLDDRLPVGYPVFIPPENRDEDGDGNPDGYNCTTPNAPGTSIENYRAQAEEDSEECEEYCGEDADLNKNETEECEAQHCRGAVTAPQGEDCTPLLRPLVELDHIDPGSCQVLSLDGLSPELTEAEQLQALRAAQDCSDAHLPIQNTLPELELRCGLQTVCLDLEATDPCENDNECPKNRCECLPGDECTEKFCVDPDLANACQGVVVDTNSLTQGPPADLTDAEGVCIGQCFSRVGCGTTEAEIDREFLRILNIPVPEDPSRCDEINLCGPLYTDEVVDASFEEKAPFEDDPLPQEPEVIPEYSSDFVDPCADRNFEDSCQDGCFDDPADCDRRVRERHPWCTNDIVDRDAKEPDEYSTTDERSGHRGESGTPVSFSIEPVSDLKFTLDPLPYGVANFEAKAAAGVRAVVDFDVLGTQGSVEVIDLRAEISATLCRATTANSRLEVVGVDFLPTIASAAIFDSDDYLELPEGADAELSYSENCEKTVAEYIDAFDRAKKALRDAQELITQYKALEEQGLTFSEDFCETVAGPGMRPPGMKGACPEEPHQVINRFIEYYEEQALERIPDAIEKLSAAVVDGDDLADLLEAAFETSLPRGEEYSFFADLGIAKKESVTLISLQFFVGPIPCLLEVTSFVDYGIKGGFGLKVDPGILIGRQGNFAQVGAEVGPYANSGVTLFVGAGFNIGILKLAVGVEGGVTLGHISLPAVVSAGLNLTRTREDSGERALPPELVNVLDPSREVLFPPRNGPEQYAYNFKYKYGIGFEVTDILTGYLNGTLKVKFAFFSKKFSQRIATFESGIDIEPIMLISGGGGDELDPELGPGSEYPGIVDDAEAPWRQSFESVPFLKLNRLKTPSSPLTKSEPFEQGKVKDLFYDELCKTCAFRGQACGRDADCCSEEDTCNGNVNGSGICGLPECAEEGPCTSDSDCCGNKGCYIQQDGTRACSLRVCDLPENSVCQRPHDQAAHCCENRPCSALGGGTQGQCKVIVQ